MELNPPLTLTALFTGIKGNPREERKGGAGVEADYFHTTLPSNVGGRREKGQFPGKGIHSGSLSWAYLPVPSFVCFYFSIVWDGRVFVDALWQQQQRTGYRVPSIKW
ncbi:hypothetical protein CDAR_189501 [Caerostris darwini]|uniref:Uncharacterized protein n=1 Tax=Caerostris darwini TaxID=1538125 RepID=A0AAV4QXS2_9ARAC|nr:hypothetical protein CDAR_189501 [Caerostris darwini]